MASKTSSLLSTGLLTAALLSLGGCSGLFFQPDRELYFTPDEFGLLHEEVSFPSSDGTLLSGLFLPVRGSARGTIIHFHGNGANLTNHLFAVRWLPGAGYSVFLFDYRGYGASAGSPSRPGAVSDGAAAIAYVRRRADVDPSRLIVYGQSLGGALAVNALAQAGTEGVRALVVESTFASYQEEVRLFLDDKWFLWPFQLLAYLLISDDASPDQALPMLVAVPLLVIHAEEDRVVPIEAGRQLFRAFPGPFKEFWSIPGMGHMRIFNDEASPWRGKLVAYLDDRLR